MGNHNVTATSKADNRIEPNSFLKVLRERLGGISQESLAHRLGVSLNSVSRWERGITPATFTLSQLKAFITLLHQAGIAIEQIPDDVTQPLKPKSKRRS